MIFMKRRETYNFALVLLIIALLFNSLNASFLISFENQIDPKTSIENTDLEIKIHKPGDFLMKNRN